MYGIDITNKVLSKHLKHLESKNLVKRTDYFQNVTYALSDKFRNIVKLPPNEIKKYLELQKEDDKLPLQLRPLKITTKEFFSDLSHDEAEKETDRDLHDIMSLNLRELKLAISNNLQLEEGESDDSFWLYVVKPTYRIKMERLSEKCRGNEEYKWLLLEKLDLLTEALRSDRELLRKRKATGRRVRA